MEVSYTQIGNEWVVTSEGRRLGRVRPTSLDISTDNGLSVRGWYATNEANTLSGPYNSLSEGVNWLVTEDWSRLMAENKAAQSGKGTARSVYDYIVANRSARDAFLWGLAKTEKIQAIKIHRELTGWGLKESKDYVENLMEYGPNALPRY